ncbi:filamentous hemagglutinin N-terminal domain-containing protein [Baaleninema sp.]|uniref:two-partner secretion domain-containing protein n=1 Tax=Baaleninema sp. TaxID=3101197 RepID=UPI003CFF96FF
MTREPQSHVSAKTALQAPRIALTALCWLSVSPQTVLGQIVPDNSLPVPSRVTPSGETYTIDGGTEAGNNLFHSFDRFSLPTATEAVFNNRPNIENVLTRVTGGEISNIDGLIRANGTANLFLLNPNGIVFGENARLDIGGSFFASTADSLVFENGLEYSARTPQTQPLLSVSVPVGLQFNGNGGAIQVRGRGHNLTVRNLVFDAIERDPQIPNPSQLQVNPGRTLALIGGEVDLNGTMLTAESGRIELGGVREGFVELIPPTSAANPHWRLDYQGVSEFRDLHLVGQTALDVSGNGVGSMQLVGENIDLRDGSIALMQNRGTQPFGLLRVQAAESLTLTGATPDGGIPTSFRPETVGAGDTGEIEIVTRRLVLQAGGQVYNRTQGSGNTGDIHIRASESIDVIGSAPTNPLATSWILNSTVGAGSTGDVTVATGNLRLRGGGSLTTSVFSSGSAGNLQIDVRDTVEAIGVEPRIILPTLISSVTNGTGNAGNVTINARRAIVRDGGRLASFTVAAGDGGRLVINAREWVEVSGTVPGSINPSSIDASANEVDIITQETFGIPAIPAGSPGNLEINTPRLRVTDGGLVTVRNDGTGGAGKLQVNAEAVSIDRGGGITAATRAGGGGNIVLNVEGSLQLRRASRVTAEAQGTGDGGNVTISTDTISLLEGSSIDANALQGNGGNIAIETQGLFVSPDSNITASSQLGVDGLVEITQPQIDTSSALMQLSAEPIDSTTQVVSACTAAQTNSFVVTGNGGLPPDPTDTLRRQTVWVDMTLTEMEFYGNRSGSKSSGSPHRFETEVLTEAIAWQRDADGTVELIGNGFLGYVRFDGPDCGDR